MTYITNPQPITEPTARKHFSTPALLFGSIIAGLGLAGIVAAGSDAGWAAGLAVGMILGGTTTVVGLLYRYRSMTPSPSPAASPVASVPGVDASGIEVPGADVPGVDVPGDGVASVDSPHER